jgi:drug/metabolite transporter (DMT)-like permease
MPISLKSLDKVRTAVIALILANIIWGAALPIYKWTLEIVPPFTFAFLRFFIGAVLLIPFVIFDFKFSKRDIPKLIFASLISVTFQIPLLLFGLKLAPSINAPIIISAGPVILLGASIVFLKEKVSTKLVVGTLISLFGVLIIIVKPAIEAGFSGGVLGNLFVFLATICSVLQALIVKKIMKDNSPLVMVFLISLIGSLTLLPLALIEYHTTGLFLFNNQALMGIAYAVVFATIIAHYLFFYGIKYINVSSVGIFAYIDPIATIVVAVPLLNETITPEYVVASIFVFAGIYIAEKRINYHPLALLRQEAQNKLFEIIG